MPITMDQFRAVSGTDNQIGLQSPTSLTVRGGSFLGRAVSWLTPARDPSVVAQENRDVMQSFVQALRTEYGTAIGNIALASQGIVDGASTPLTGRMVRQVLQDADTAVLLLSEQKQSDIKGRLEQVTAQIQPLQQLFNRLAQAGSGTVALSQDETTMLLGLGIDQQVLDGPSSDLMLEIAQKTTPLITQETSLKGELQAERATLLKSAKNLLGPDGLTVNEVKALPTRQKAMLMEALGDKALHGTETEKQEALKLLKTLHSRIVPGDYCPVSENAKRTDLQDRLRNDPTIKLAREQWSTLTREQKKAVLQTISDHHARAYGLQTSTMQYADLPDGTYGDCGGDTVRISNAILDTVPFARIANTVIHENTHRYQHDLIAKLDAGQLQPTDDRIGQAMLMRANQQCYLSHDTYGYDAYRGQPNERHAFEEGDVGQQFITALT